MTLWVLEMLCKIIEIINVTINVIVWLIFLFTLNIILLPVITGNLIYQSFSSWYIREFR